MLADTPPTLPPGGGSASDLAARLGQFQMPSQDEFLNHLTATMGYLQAILFLACGLVYLLYGWKVFKVLVVVNAAILGALVGAWAGGKAGGNMPIYGGIAGALLLGALSWPLMKYAVSIMGALAGSVLGYGVWNFITRAANSTMDKYAWVGALVGLITLGLLGFIIFRATIIAFTTLQGAIMSVSGALGILLKQEWCSSGVSNALRTNPLLLPLLFVVPAVIGFVVQQTSGGKKGGGKKPSGGGGGSGGG
ncbi:MAG: hypothetical protein ACE15C_10655 [Phycisphaerae bacterium]